MDLLAAVLMHLSTGLFVAPEIRVRSTLYSWSRFLGFQVGTLGSIVKML